MSRQKKCRRICSLPTYEDFSPTGGTCDKKVFMEIDEYETIRLIDYQKLTQEQCAQQMHIARTTVTAIYDSARKKLADVVVNGKRLIISGGDIELCNQTNFCSNKGCSHCCKKNKLL